MATASDDFNRANESPIAGNWETISSAGCRLQTNQVDGTSSVNNNVSGWKSSVNDFNDDQFSQAQIISQANSDHGGVGVRLLSASGGSGYVVYFNNGSSQLLLQRLVAGVFTTIQTIGSITWVSGDTLKLTATQNGANVELRVYQNDVQKGSTFTDSANPQNGGQPGLFYQWGNNRSTKLDNWAGGDGTGVGGGGNANLFTGKFGAPFRGKL